MPVMPFHLAFLVTSLDKARPFYGGLMGCPEGRWSPEWIDFDFHGHQIVAHLSSSRLSRIPPCCSRNELLMHAASSHPGQIGEIHGAIQ